VIRRKPTLKRRTLLRGGLSLCLLAFFAGTGRSDLSLAIVPPYVEKLVPAGSKLSDTLSFTNRGNEPVVVTVDLADFGVDEAGQVAERPPGTHDTTLARNLRISPMRVRVAPDQRVFFRYSVNTPDDFTHLRSMIYLSSHPEVDAGMNQVLVVARMGVPLYVENIKAASADLTIHELAWDRPEETPDRLRLRLLVTNDGERNIRPKGFVHLRSDDGRFDETFDFNEGREPVLPGQTRLWEQYFGPVPDGQLSARLRFETSPRHTHRADSVIPAFEG